MTESMQGGGDAWEKDDDGEVDCGGEVELVERETWSRSRQVSSIASVGGEGKWMERSAIAGSL